LESPSKYPPKSSEHWLKESLKTFPGFFHDDMIPVVFSLYTYFLDENFNFENI
jgi:hypothetical protein